MTELDSYRKNEPVSEVDQIYTKPREFPPAWYFLGCYGTWHISTRALVVEDPDPKKTLQGADIVQAICTSGENDGVWHGPFAEPKAWEFGGYQAICRACEQLQRSTNNQTKN